MKTVIVPVDFSPTSYKSSRYAVKMVNDNYYVKLLIFHVFEKETEEEESYFLLEKLKTELSEQGIAKISCHAELGSDFPDALSRFARHRAAQLIVMGLTGKSKLEQI